MRLLLAVHVILPVFVGATIYLLFRDADLLVFRWMAFVGLSEPVHLLRQNISFSIPHWVNYSLPDGLWLYALTSWITIIWEGRPPFLWLAIVLALGAGSELGQAMGIVMGTYQHLDMVAYLSGFGLAKLQLGE